ncbi:MAG: hypothetical protein JRN46_05795 [Nitrososphaerota archaeon]|nr:hypothetical protein [Nitrososphaerota archaeon]
MKCGLHKRHERIYGDFERFLSCFVSDLNDKSEDGWSVLVEGKRDSIALRTLGYKGRILTVSVLGKSGSAALGGVEKMVILTDMDREGALLASKYSRSLIHEGFVTSLGERSKLRLASRGVFLQIENLGKFAKVEASSLEPDGPPGVAEGLHRPVTPNLRRRVGKDVRPSQ